MREKKEQDKKPEVVEQSKVDVKEEKKEVSDGVTRVMPKKDFKIAHNGNVFDLKEGVESEVPSMFIQNLKTEGVI